MDGNGLVKDSWVIILSTCSCNFSKSSSRVFNCACSSAIFASCCLDLRIRLSNGGRPVALTSGVSKGDEREVSVDDDSKLLSCSCSCIFDFIFLLIVSPGICDFSVVRYLTLARCFQLFAVYDACY